MWFFYFFIFYCQWVRHMEDGSVNYIDGIFLFSLSSLVLYVFYYHPYLDMWVLCCFRWQEQSNQTILSQLMMLKHTLLLKCSLWTTGSARYCFSFPLLLPPPHPKKKDKILIDNKKGKKKAIMRSLSKQALVSIPLKKKKT